MSRRLLSGLVPAVLALLVTACLPPARPPATPTPAVPGTTPEPTGVPAPTPRATPAVPPTRLPTALPTAPPAPTPAVAPRAPNKRGVHLLLDDGGFRWPAEVWEQHVEWAARLVGRGGSVVQLIRSNDLDPQAWQPFFDVVAREELIPIIRVATFKDEANQWWVPPESDPGGQTYLGQAERLRRFLDAIVWRTDQVVVTVGNEPNRADEWGGAPDPAAYARYLRDFSEALKRVSAVRVVVLNAGLDGYAPSTPMSPNGAGQPTYTVDSERFIEGMLAEVPDILDRIDGWASHAYPIGPFIEHPSRQQFKIDDIRPEAGTRANPPPDVFNRGVNGYTWELWKLTQLGLSRPLPVYITESGWRHRRSQSTKSNDSAHATVEDERFAEYISLVYDGPPDAPAQGWTPWNRDPRVVSASLFALAGKPEYWGHTNLLLVEPNGRIITAYGFAVALAAVQPGPLARGEPRDDNRR